MENNSFINYEEHVKVFNVFFYIMSINYMMHQYSS